MRIAALGVLQVGVLVHDGADGRWEAEEVVGIGVAMGHGGETRSLGRDSTKHLARGTQEEGARRWAGQELAKPPVCL